MSGAHSDVGPELRALAQSILNRLEPAVRLAAARAASATGPGRCQQVWCPVCALAALVNGEQHPLLSIVAEHSVALLAVVKAIVNDADAAASGPAGPDGGGGDSPPPASPPPGRYQHIPVTVRE
jgi:hypothetical protein